MEREGSRTGQRSLKTCKDDHQKQVNSLLMKAMRPKVYITDSSSFKMLVQELTGNGRHAMSPPSPSTIEMHDHHTPVITIEDYGEEPEVYMSLGGEETYGGMQPTSIDNSQDSGIPTLSPLAAFTALQSTWVTEQLGHDFQYPEVDHASWPLEIDPIFPFDDVYSFQTDEEMLFNQCDLSELYNIL